MAIFATTATVVLSSISLPYAHAVDVPSNATILAICGVETSPGTINLRLPPSAESIGHTLQIINTEIQKQTFL